MATDRELNTAELKKLSPEVRRRNRRLGWAVAVLAIACALWSTRAVRNGWIYPQDTTYSFPHWMKK